MTTGLIEAALHANSAPGVDAATAASNLEVAIIATIVSATINMTPLSLVAPSGGGPVTQSGPSIGTLS